MSSTLNKRKCACGQFIATHDNGTLKRHTRPGLLDIMNRNYTPPKRVHCHYSGKFPPAIVRMRFDVNARQDREIKSLEAKAALTAVALKDSTSADEKELFKARLKMLNDAVRFTEAAKYPRTQIMVSHAKEGSRKARKADTRHVSGGQVTSRKRFTVAVAR